jgi:hypothetical protein
MLPLTSFHHTFLPARRDEIAKVFGDYGTRRWP